MGWAYKIVKLRFGSARSKPRPAVRRFLISVSGGQPDENTGFDETGFHLHFLYRLLIHGCGVPGQNVPPPCPAGTSGSISLERSGSPARLSPPSTKAHPGADASNRSRKQRPGSFAFPSIPVGSYTNQSWEMPGIPKPPRQNQQHAGGRHSASRSTFTLEIGSGHGTWLRVESVGSHRSNTSNRHARQRGPKKQTHRPRFPLNGRKSRSNLIVLEPGVPRSAKREPLSTSNGMRAQAGKRHHRWD